MQLDTDVVVNPSLRYGTYALFASEYRECIEARLAPCGDGGYETLDAVRTLLKGGERFLEI
jgi:hypothetical protein